MKGESPCLNQTLSESAVIPYIQDPGFAAHAGWPNSAKSQHGVRIADTISTRANTAALLYPNAVGLATRSTYRTCTPVSNVESRALNSRAQSPQDNCAVSAG